MDRIVREDQRKQEMLDTAEGLRPSIEFIPNPTPMIMVRDSAGAIHMRLSPELRKEIGGFRERRRNTY